MSNPANRNKLSGDPSFGPWIMVTYHSSHGWESGRVGGGSLRGPHAPSTIGDEGSEFWLRSPMYG